MKNTAHRWAALGTAAILAGALVSCSTTAPTTETPGAGPEIPAEYQRLVLVGASQGGSLYNWAVAVSQLFNTELGMETSVQASGTQANALDLESGVIEFGMTSPGDLIQVAGDESALDSTELRTLSAAISTPFHVLVAANSDIDSIEDLAGHGMVTGVTGSIESEIALTMLKCAAVDPSAVSVQNVGKSEGAAAFGDGTVDAWTGLGTTPTAAFLEAFQSQRGAKLLPLDDDVRQCIMEKFPDLEEAVIPADTYEGQSEDIDTLSQWFYATVPASMPDDVVQLLAATIYDNHDELVRALPAAADSTAQNTADFPGFTLHPGTVAALEAAGIEIDQ